MSTSKKRIVVWGTGFVGKLVIPEIVKHPEFELVGVGVSNPEKVGKDVGTICGIDPIGLAATDDVAQLIGTDPDALVHYGPTAAYARDNIKLMKKFLLAGIDVCSTAMTPWVWPSMTKNPPQWIAPIEEACAQGGASCFTTGIDPGFANDLFPMTLMGLCGEVRIVRRRCSGSIAGKHSARLRHATRASRKPNQRVNMPSPPPRTCRARNGRQPISHKMA